MTLEIDAPNDNPALPSYEHPALREIRDDLTKAFDCFHCLRGEGVKQKYLPQEPAEPHDAYKGRLGRSVFSDFFRASIHAFSGCLLYTSDAADE